MSDATALLGRDELLARCRAGLADGGGVLLTGEAGVGKSAVLDTLDAEATDAGALVLRSHASAAESALPYLTLYDLFAGPSVEHEGLIAPHLRSALDVALQRAPADGVPVGQLALRVAVLELLRALAATRPVLLVLDDAQCLDPAGAQVLGFAVRRLHGHRVGVAATERVTEGGEPRCLDLLPEPRTELAVGTLPAPVIAELLNSRVGLTRRHPLSERIRIACGGNPHHALQLARATLRADPPPPPDGPLVIPDRLRAPFAERLAAMPPEAVQALLLSAATNRLRRGPTTGAGTPTADRGPATPDRRPGSAYPSLNSLDPGQGSAQNSLPTADRDLGSAHPNPASPHRDLGSAHPNPASPHRDLGSAHLNPASPDRAPWPTDPSPWPAAPLLLEIVYGDATDAQRRACHATLARTLDDPLERARHRALAEPGADAGLARELTEAAVTAVDRGAPALAAELSRLAAERTPDDPDLAAERLLDCARHARDAGLADRARETCELLLGSPNRTARVGARLLLVELAGHDRAAVPALLDAAQADAGDVPRLRATVRLRRAEHAISTGRTDLGLAELAEAERQAEHSDDVEQQIQAIALRAPIEMQSHRDRVLPSLRRATVLSARRSDRSLTAAAIQVRCCRVVWLLRTGDVTEAVNAVNLLRAEVERAGRISDLGDVLHMVASVHERAGLCAEAYRAGVLGGRMRVELGPTPGPGLMLSAAAELNGGTAERAGELAEAAHRAGELAEDPEWSAYALGLRGRADLLGHRFPQAAEHLGRCRSLLRGIGLTDPALFLVDADLVEALARSGAVDEARRVLDEATREAARLDRQVLRLGLARARAVLTGLDGDPRGAADALRADLPPAHPYPLEAARARLTLGELERRARRRAAARADLRCAAQAFAASQCLPWLGYARDRLARLDEPATALSDLERQIVGLVQQGATNRQIAAGLHISVKSVEGTLTRLFRRFGVRDRTELTLRRIAGQPG